MKRFVLKALSMLVIIAGTFSMNVFAKGWATDGSDWFYYDSEDSLETSVIKPSGDKRFYLDENGYMVRDYLLEDYNDNVYYFNEEGEMVLNTWVAVDPSQVQNGMENPPSVYLYYFGSNGKAYKGLKNKPAKKTIDGKKYLFNGDGQMLSGWIDDDGNQFNYFNTDEDPFIGYCYYAGDETDGVLREGWTSYEDGSVDDRYYKKETLWFYFRPSSCKKECSSSSDSFKKVTINGKQYGFDENGVMIQGWETDMIPDITVTKNYFSESNLEDERGRLYKKEWIFAVPSAIMSETPSTDEAGLDRPDTNDHDEEVQRWFYALGSGDIVKNSMRKIDSNYFVFNKSGVMRHGLCIIENNTNKYFDCIDLEKTDGKDFIRSRMYVSLDAYSASVPHKLFDDTKYKIFYFEPNEQSSEFGLRRTGDCTVSFMDDDYTFSSSTQGEYEGLKKKKYYQAGINLKADKGIGLGLVLVGFSSTSEATKVDKKPVYYQKGAPATAYGQLDEEHKIDGTQFLYTDYIVKDDPSFCSEKHAYPVYKVVDANGKAVEKPNKYIKDKTGHYWLLGANSSLVKIFDVPIKYNKSQDIWYFKSEKEDSSTHKISTTWIPFRDSPGFEAGKLCTPSDLELEAFSTDAYGKTCYLDRAKPADKTKTYETYIDDSYAVNFRFADK